jgi:hypothetical protein
VRIRNQIVVIAGLAGVMLGVGACAQAVSQLADVLGADPNAPDSGDPNAPDANSPPAGGDPNAPAAGDPVGTVEAQICTDLISVTTGGLFPATQIYRNTSGGDPFARWLAGDEVAFDEQSSELINLKRDLRVAAELLGQVSAISQIATRSSVVITLRLADGTFWLIPSALRVELSSWREGEDEVLVIQSPLGENEWWLVNLRRCTLLPAELQS